MKVFGNNREEDMAHWLRVTGFCSLTRHFRVLIRDYQTIIEKIPCIFFLGEAVCSVQISHYAFLVITKISAPAGNFAFSPALKDHAQA